MRLRRVAGGVRASGRNMVRDGGKRGNKKRQTAKKGDKRRDERPVGRQTEGQNQWTHAGGLGEKGFH